MGEEIEAQTNLPPFLIPRALEDWQRVNSQQIEAQKTRREGFKIKPGSSLFVEDQKRMGLKYRFLDVQGNQWQLFVPKQERTLKSPGVSLERLSQEFEVRQIFPQPQNKTEENRQKAQDFLAANWDRLWRVFYFQEGTHQEGKEDQTLEVFSNVNLDQLGKIDLIAIGPDGKIFVFNINQSFEKEQVEKYKAGLMNLAKKLGLSINDGNFRFFSILPTFSSSANTLIITEVNK